MGLKINNYKSIKFGIELPQAYAVIDRVLVTGNVIDPKANFHNFIDSNVAADSILFIDEEKKP